MLKIVNTNKRLDLMYSLFIIGTNVEVFMTEFTTYRGVKLLTDDEIDNFVKTLRHSDVDDLLSTAPESFEARAIATILHLQEQGEGYGYSNDSYDEESYGDSYDEDSWEAPEDFKEERLIED